ncbi:WG repeat-containing protein [Catalinimonas sp. 4WD22]|uniref:WG repeat-containing protein n=1 Tax=Catalinimonas locisalis TaxID=3133978 RepID=UPI0031013F6D
MKKHLLFIFLFFFLISACNSSKQALKFLQKQKFAEVKHTLDKAIAKDTLNADLYYVYSLLYTDTSYSAYNIDSSFYFIRKAIEDYQASDVKSKEKLQKQGIDSLALVQQKLYNDTLAFERAQNLHEVQSYQNFLDTHPDAPQVQIQEAIQNRNHLAYRAANNLDTYEAYKEFMDTYPQAKEFNLAKERYNTLVFREKTRSGDLQSYIDFLEAFPDSPFRPQAEEQILQITTASNQLNSYENFIKNYPSSQHIRLAVNLFYHLYVAAHDKESFFKSYKNYPLTDSLKKAAQFSERMLAPIFENQHYGLLDSKGKYIVDTQYNLIPTHYFCEGVTDEIIHLATADKDYVFHSLLSKAGETIYEYQLPRNNIESSGNLFSQKVYGMQAGLMLIENEEGNYQLMHQAGLPIYPKVDWTYPLDTALLIPAMPSEAVPFQFIKIEENGLWGLISFSGRVLLEPVYEEIEEYGNFIVLSKQGLKAITTREKIINSADQNGLELSFRYEDAALLDQQHIVAFSDQYETVLDVNLNTAVPLARQNIIRLINGSESPNKKWLLRENRTEAYVKNDTLLNRNTAVYYLYDKQNLSDQPEITYQKAYFNKRWLALKNKQGFHLFDSQTDNEKNVYDSVKLVGESFALLFESFQDAKDSVKVLFQNGGKLALVSPERITFLLLRPGSTTNEKENEYLLISPKNGPKEVWSQSGKRILTGNFSNLNLYPSGLFVVEERGKKGLLDSLGNELVPIRYQGISNYKDSTLAIFQNKRFGIYRYPSKTMIEPRYEAMLQSYGSPVYQKGDSSFYEIFIARKDDAYGLINQNNVQLTDFTFDEVRYWNDTSAFVKSEDEWMIYRFSPSEEFDDEKEYILYDGISDFDIVQSDAQEKVIKIYKDGGYGILSNQRGEILAPTYDDIRLFGSITNQEDIIYYSEKYVPEADLYIIIHLDYKGNIIKRQALTSEQYDMVFCEE